MTTTTFDLEENYREWWAYHAGPIFVTDKIFNLYMLGKFLMGLDNHRLMESGQIASTRYFDDDA